MENDRIAENIYIGEYAGNRSIGWLRKWWIDTVEDCLKKRGLEVRLTRRMVHDRSLWWGNTWGCCPGDEPLTLTKCYSCEMLQLMKPGQGGNPSVA